MIHSQLRTKFPNHPYISTLDKIQKLETDQVDFNKIDHEIMIDLIQKYYDPKMEVVYGSNYDTDIYTFLKNITYNDNNNKSPFTKIFYSHVKQKYQSVHDKYIYINFHTTVYMNEKGSLIKDDCDSNISWTVIPLNCCVNISNKLNLNYTIRENKLKPKQIKNDNKIQIDECNKIETNILKIRQNARKIYTRDTNDTVIVKHDTYTEKVDEFNQCVIRDIFDYQYENAGIKKFNRILRFFPIETGRIEIEKTDSDKYIFLSILCHNENLHITFHILDKSI